MKKFLKIYIVYVLVLLSVLYLLPPDVGAQLEYFSEYFIQFMQKPETLQNVVNFSVLIISISIITNIYKKIKEHQKNEK